MRKIFPVLIALTLWGCSGPQPTATPGEVASATPVPVAQDGTWFTYFPPDGSFSVQFPKAPRSVGKGPGSEVLAHALDQKGSSLSLITMQLPEDLNLEKMLARPGMKAVKQEKVKWGGHEGSRVELVAGGNRVWILMFPVKPYLYQLVALQSSTSTQDYAAERSQFFASFQFTQSK